MKIYFIIFILLFRCLDIYSESSDSSFFLIPQPKKIELTNGVYSFKRPYSINTNDDKFCAQEIQDAIAKKFSIKSGAPRPGQNQIQLVRAEGADFDKIIQGQKLSPPFELSAEGYIISISPIRISIVAHDDAGIFYGAQTLIQLINANAKDNAIPCLVIYDKPDMAMRGWQDDISRGPIPTLEFLKEEIRRMASFKLNTFTLYTEHVFKLKKHPDIAPADGITAEEISELSNFARNYHVDIIGNFQSFGHFGNILKLPAYANMAENAATLSPAKEESYKFLADVYSEIAPAYSSKYFHINCDEVSLGDGPSKKLIDSIGIGGVYAYHINRIDSLLKPYHKQIMMWGDIAVNNPKIINRLPKDMIIVCWDYGPLENFKDDILPFVKSGFQFIVAPGVSCWGAIYPDLDRAVINIYNFLRDGYKYKASGFINTTWDDDGQNLFNNNWYSLVWGADCGWNAPLDEPLKRSEESRKARLALFNKSYNKIYYGTDKDITALLFGIADLKNGPVKNCLSDESIWNPLLPDYNIIPENYERDNLNLIKTIDSLSAVANVLEPYFGEKEFEFSLLPFAFRQARLVAHKNLLGIKLKNYTQDETTKGSSIFTNDFKALDDTVLNLRTAYGKLWSLENRKWWLDTVYSYYDSFPTKLDALKGVCIIKASDTLLKGKREITLRSVYNDLPVYYTTDGTPPTTQSAKYSYPILTDSNITISARVIDAGKSYDAAGDSLIFHKGIGKLYKLNSKWSNENATCAAGGAYALLDGRRGNKNNEDDGRWQAYLGNDIDVELNFNEIATIHQITMGFTQYQRRGILFPERVEILSSPDGVNYTLIKTLENTIDQKTEQHLTHDYVITLDDIRSQYIKIIAKNAGPLPEWHFASGKPSWLYSDEIIVE